MICPWVHKYNEILEIMYLGSTVHNKAKFCLEVLWWTSVVHGSIVKWTHSTWVYGIVNIYAGQRFETLSHLCFLSSSWLWGLKNKWWPAEANWCLSPQVPSQKHEASVEWPYIKWATVLWEWTEACYLYSLWASTLAIRACVMLPRSLSSSLGFIHWRQLWLE